MIERRRWLRPAALFAAAAVALGARRRLERADERLEQHYAVAQAEQDLTVSEAEATLPEPTVWPAVLALGVVCGLWGIILDNIFFGIGLLLAIVALSAWMNVLFHEHHEKHIMPREEPSSK